MVHRDPQTGQFVESDGDMSMLTYADHDVHHCRHLLRYEDDADAGPTVGTDNVERYEITERGLDPDELAELRAMRITATVRVRADGAQDSRGSVLAEIGAGFNLSGTEFIGTAADATSIDVDDSGTADFTAQTRDTDEVGQLYTQRLSTAIGFDDDANANGGSGGGEPTISETISFPALTGTGPVVDSADDFVSRVNLVVNNSITTVETDVRYTLYYAVEETESGRTRFGR